MIELKNASKVYLTGNIETHALRGVDLSVSKGEYVALLGPSGSGKSTFLAIAGLMDTLSSGLYRLNGIDVSTMPDSQRSRLRNQHIGFVFQRSNMLPELNIRENVELPLRFRGMPATERRERSLAAMAAVGLADRAAHRPNQLSGGQQQRAAIARALVGEPKVLLADEPSGNLDSQSTADIAKIFDGLHARGATLVLVTHDMHLSRRAQRQVSILDGQILVA